MKIVKVIERSGDYKYYNVYENVEEFNASGIPLTDNFFDLKPGDYIRTDNGYYVPLRYRTESYYAKRDCKFYRFFFPFCSHTIVWRFGKFDKSRFSFMWNPYKKEQEYKRMSPQDKLFAMYLSQGVDIVLAFRMCYKTKNTLEQRKIISKKLRSENFIELLRSYGFMANIRDTGERVGLTEEWFCKQLKDIIEDRKMPAAVINESIKLAYNILNDDKQNTKLKTLPSPKQELVSPDTIAEEMENDYR